MKIIRNLLIGAILCLPQFVSADDAIKLDRPVYRNYAEILQGVPVQRIYSCPAGWNKVKDITNDKSKWREASPVLTCRPVRPVINCPPGTYFYITGNVNLTNNGEIGCRTPVW